MRQHEGTPGAKAVRATREASRGGFTLVELLAATAITVFLMVAVLRVATAIRATHAATSEPGDLAWPSACLMVIAADLRAAEDSTTVAVGRPFATTIHHDPSQPRRRDWPVTVSYRIDPASQSLYRVQVDRTQLGASPRIMLLARGVIQLELEDQAPRLPSDEAGITKALSEGVDEPPTLRPTKLVRLILTNGMSYREVVRW